MFVFGFVFFFSVFFVFLFYVLNFFLSFRVGSFFKLTQYECGFLSVGFVQNSFSIHFFVIALLFILFDLEIVMFIGVLVADINSFFSFLLLFFFIVFGFYMEWWYGKLFWSV